MLSLDEVRDENALKALQAEWTTLLAQSREATPFQSWEWVYPWWCHYRQGSLCVYTIREHSRLVALFPLVETRLWKLPIRRLAFMGAPGSDYNAMLAVAGREEECWQAFLHHLDSHKQSWDLTDFVFLREGSTLTRSRSESLQMDLLTCRRCPQSVLPSTWDDYLTLLTRKMRSNISRGRKQMVRDFQAVIETTQSDDVAATMTAFFRLHAMRWESRGVSGAFSDPGVQAWHQEVARGFQSQGWLRLHRVRIGEEIKAVLYCFRFGDLTMFYNCGFDISLARYSPGTVLLSHAIEAAIAEGCRAFDFTRGDETYKYDWHVQEEHSYRLMIGSGTLRSRLALLLVRMENQVEALGSYLRNWIWGRHSMKTRIAARWMSLTAKLKRRFSNPDASAKRSAQKPDRPAQQQSVAQQQKRRSPRTQTTDGVKHDLGQTADDHKQPGQPPIHSQG
jgi:CelD/BcsL family acetyltransferase involved in cellulose biosynthesis